MESGTRALSRTTIVNDDDHEDDHHSDDVDDHHEDDLDDVDDDFDGDGYEHSCSPTIV